jgi:predicted nucleic acid-binding protein
LTLVWDTTVVSRIYPGGPLERHLVERARSDEPISITAPTVMEVVRGIQATLATRQQISDNRPVPALAWFIRLIASDLVEILSLDRAAAILAGQLRALRPVPPTGARRKGVKPEQRAGWVLDIQIAACAWTHGREIVTENRRDFEALRDLIAQLHPDTSPLAVTPPPTI